MARNTEKQMKVARLVHDIEVEAIDPDALLQFKKEAHRSLEALKTLYLKGNERSASNIHEHEGDCSHCVAIYNKSIIDL